MGEKRAALIRVSSSEAAFAILARVVLFAAFCVVGGRRTRVRREAFGGIFFVFLAHTRRARSQTGPDSAGLISELVLPNAHQQVDLRLICAMFG